MEYPGYVQMHFKEMVEIKIADEEGYV
jgi:hypothetical protein